MKIFNRNALIIFNILNRLFFTINGKKYTVPMAVEEASVIAAASSAAKFISDRTEGFVT
jgi:hydroxymethylglutaryl-CoA reductase